ncbi:MAG TPA: phosphotriesterase-related protein [Acidimicrobiales bacterium]|nr:phosphotriesterase-related protein [Acidimicrobiales bacterium]
MVETVGGPVDAADLGVTLMHEHLCILSDGLVQAFPRVWDRQACLDEAVARMHEAASHGVRTVVDLTVLGLGRDIDFIAEVAAQVPVNVVVATGAYYFEQLPPYFRSRSIDHLAEQFIADIEEGIGNTAIKAAVIKCTTDAPGVTDDVDKLLRATARAQLATGALISTHSNARSRTGLDQLRIFLEEGVDPSRIVIGHCGDTDDLDYLKEVGDSGAFMGLDRFGIDAQLPLEKRAATLVALYQRGYGDQLVVSHDYCCYIDWFPKDHPVLVPRSIGHLFVDVVPRLREAGLDQDAIDTLFVHNPRRALGGPKE